jgi:hyperosmotically inducible periplasmic protein
MNITRYRTTLIAAAVAAALGVSAAACTKTPDYASKDTRSSTASEAISDTAITAQVKTKLATDSNIKSSDISVTTVNGVVTLEGSVDDAAAKSAAERTAKSVTGVTSVSNRLSTPSGSMTAMKTTAEDAQDAMSDTWITTKVKSLLLADSDAKGFDVKVETRDGIVILEGELETQAAIAHVRDIAAGVEGVKSVNTTAMTVNDKR